MGTAYLGLGSNQGDRLANLRAAVAALDRRGIRVVRRSSVYETEAVAEAAGQRDFLNACVEVETALAPDELLEACKAVERELGRATPRRRHAPRPIDVDVLLLEDGEHRSEWLTVPHPDLLQRRFALLPLLELDSALRLPGGPALADALPAVARQRAERVAAL